MLNRREFTQASRLDISTYACILLNVVCAWMGYALGLYSGLPEHPNGVV
jgi:hypothetical protein